MTHYRSLKLRNNLCHRLKNVAAVNHGCFSISFPSDFVVGIIDYSRHSRYSRYGRYSRYNRYGRYNRYNRYRRYNR